MSNAFAGIPDLIENTATRLVSPEDHDGVKTADDQLQDMLQAFVNKTLNERLNSIEFGDRFLRKIEEAKTSPPHVKTMTRGTLNIHNIIALVAMIVEKEANRAVDVKSERVTRRQELVDDAQSTDILSVPSSDGPHTYVWDESTDKKAYCNILEEQAPGLPPCNDVTAGSKLMRCEVRPDTELDLPGLKVVEPINGCFAVAVDFRY